MICIYPLGRIPSRPDNKDHVLSLYILPVALPAKYKAKHRFPVYNQGDSPRCVGFSGALNRTIEEVTDEKIKDLFDGDELYARCKENDGYPNEDGTEIRIALGILKDRGARNSLGEFKGIAAYARLNSIEEIKTAVLTSGVAWIGSVWYNSWFTPSKSGLLPKPDYSAGGHAYTIIGWSDTKQAFQIQNSWSKDWAVNGKAWLPYKYIDFNGDWEAWSTIDKLHD